MNPFLSKDQLQKLTNDSLFSLHWTVFGKGAPTKWKKAQLVDSMEGFASQSHLEEVQSKEKAQQEKLNEDLLTFYNFKVGDIICACPTHRACTYFYVVIGFTKTGGVQTRRLERKVEPVFVCSDSSKIKVTPLFNQKKEKVTFRKTKDALYKKGSLHLLPHVYNKFQEYFDEAYY